MASARYPKGMKHLLDGDVDMLGDDIVAILYDSGAGPYDAADEFIGDLPALGIIDTSGPLSGKTTTLGVFDANNETVLAIPASTIEALIIAQATGNPATSILLVYLELAAPYTSTGGDATIVWNASGIFELGAC